MIEIICKAQTLDRELSNETISEKREEKRLKLSELLKELNKVAEEAKQFKERLPHSQKKLEALKAL